MSYKKTRNNHYSLSTIYILRLFFLKKHINQSKQYISLFLVSIISLATPHDPGGDIITSSPGRQLAGVAILLHQLFCNL